MAGSRARNLLSARLSRNTGAVGDHGGGGGGGGGNGGCHELTQFVREKQMSAEKILAQIFPKHHIAVCRILALMGLLV